jgi:hypothetical protein
MKMTGGPSDRAAGRFCRHRESLPDPMWRFALPPHCRQSAVGESCGVAERPRTEHSGAPNHQREKRAHANQTLGNDYRWRCGGRGACCCDAGAEACRSTLAWLLGLRSSRSRRHCRCGDCIGGLCCPTLLLSAAGGLSLLRSCLSLSASPALPALWAAALVLPLGRRGNGR